MESPSILLAEDLPFYRGYLRDLLRELGYRDVTEVPDGREALGVLASRDVDLIISDYCMAPLSGLELLRAAREYLDLSETPFIMITGIGDEATLAQAELYRVSMYLRKPIHVELFRQTVEDALRGSLSRSLAEKYRHLR